MENKALRPVFVSECLEVDGCDGGVWFVVMNLSGSLKLPRTKYGYTLVDLGASAPS